jgi:CDK inhibitor PHO81
MSTHPCLPSPTHLFPPVVASANLLSLEQLVGTDAHQRPDTSTLADGTSIDGSLRQSAPHLPTLFDRADRAEALEDLETALVSAVKAGDRAIVQEVLGLLVPGRGGASGVGEPKSPVARILWRAALEEKGEETVEGQEKAEGAIPQGLLDFSFVDDINGRTALHEVRFRSIRHASKG